MKSFVEIHRTYWTWGASRHEVSTEPGPAFRTRFEAKQGGQAMIPDRSVWVAKWVHCAVDAGALKTFLNRKLADECRVKAAVSYSNWVSLVLLATGSTTQFVVPSTVTEFLPPNHRAYAGRPKKPGEMFPELGS